MQTHFVSKIMHQNLAVILQQFNYGKNSFIVLVPIGCYFLATSYVYYWFEMTTRDVSSTPSKAFVLLSIWLLSSFPWDHLRLKLSSLKINDDDDGLSNFAAGKQPRGRRRPWRQRPMKNSRKRFFRKKLFLEFSVRLSFCAYSPTHSLYSMLRYYLTNLCFTAATPLRSMSSFCLSVYSFATFVFICVCLHYHCLSYCCHSIFVCLIIVCILFGCLLFVCLSLCLFESSLSVLPIVVYFSLSICIMIILCLYVSLFVCLVIGCLSFCVPMLLRLSYHCLSVLSGLLLCVSWHYLSLLKTIVLYHFHSYRLSVCVSASIWRLCQSPFKFRKSEKVQQIQTFVGLGVGSSSLGWRFLKARSHRAYYTA